MCERRWGTTSVRIGRKVGSRKSEGVGVGERVESKGAGKVVGLRV